MLVNAAGGPKRANAKRRARLKKPREPAVSVAQDTDSDPLKGTPPEVYKILYGELPSCVSDTATQTVTDVLHGTSPEVYQILYGELPPGVSSTTDVGSASASDDNSATNDESPHAENARATLRTMSLAAIRKGNPVRPAMGMPMMVMRWSHLRIRSPPIGIPRQR